MRQIKAIGALVTCVMGIALIACREQSSEEVAAKIAASEELRHIDQLCIEFPKPYSFRQINKRISGNSENTTIYYQYVSDISFAAVRGFYRDPSIRGDYVLISEDYREPEGFISQLTLRRQDVGIVLEHRPPSAIFNVGCYK